MYLSQVPGMLGAMALGVTMLSGCGSRDDHGQGREKRVVNVYQWSDYFGPGVLEDFERESGIKVVYNVFASHEAMEAKMLVGSTGYDLVDVPSYAIERLAKAGVLQKLQRSKFTNWSNLDADLIHSLQQTTLHDDYAVGYLWGTTGIAYDAAALDSRKALDSGSSWRLVFDPQIVAKAAACGVSFNNHPTEIIGNALIGLGVDPAHASASDLAAAEGVLMKVRPFVRHIDGDAQINEMAEGAMCLLVASSSNFSTARLRAREAGVKFDLRYVIPKEGAISWFDTLAIPSDAPHAAEAYAFLDYLMRPEIAARNANFTGGATVNRAALSQVDPSIREDPMLYPGDAIRSTLRPLQSLPPAETRAVTELWRRFEFNTSK